MEEVLALILYSGRKWKPGGHLYFGQQGRAVLSLRVFFHTI